VSVKGIDTDDGERLLEETARKLKGFWASDAEPDDEYRRKCHSALDKILDWNERRHGGLDKALGELAQRRCSGDRFRRRRM